MKNIPLLAFVVIVYNVIAFIDIHFLEGIVFTFRMISEAEWRFMIGDLLVSLSVILLYIEVFKATRTSSASIMDHGLSLLVFIVCLIEFIVLKPMGTSVFFIITLICLLDVIAGFTITIKTARRDIGLGEHTL